MISPGLWPHKFTPNIDDTATCPGLFPPATPPRLQGKKPERHRWEIRHPRPHPSIPASISDRGIHPFFLSVVVSDAWLDERIPLLFAYNYRPKVVPLWIGLLNHCDLPCSIPFFDLLLTSNGLSHVAVKLKVNEAMKTVSLRKSIHGTISVLPHPSDQVAGNTGVE